MAETRPLKVPTFNTGGANRAEPAAGKKTLGAVGPAGVERRHL